MDNMFLRDLSIYWSLIHLALIFVMLFQSRFDRKRDMDSVRNRDRRIDVV